MQVSMFMHAYSHTVICMFVYAHIMKKVISWGQLRTGKGKQKQNRGQQTCNKDRGKMTSNENTPDRKEKTTVTTIGKESQAKEIILKAQVIKTAC